MREKAVQIVQNYADDLRYSLRAAKSREERRQIVYALTSAEEILDILNSSSSHPLEIVEYYIGLMDDYACRNLKNSYMYSCGYDTAYDIYDRLCQHYDTLFSSWPM